MVEVPSAALLAEQFAREVDFFSIGTNDLTQYTLAMDRGHPAARAAGGRAVAGGPAAHRADGRAPRAQHGRWVGVCGGIAGDPQAVPILVGLGVDELSVSVPAIPAVKAQIRRLRLERVPRARRAARSSCATAADVRALVAAETRPS